MNLSLDIEKLRALATSLRGNLQKLHTIFTVLLVTLFPVLSDVVQIFPSEGKPLARRISSVGSSPTLHALFGMNS